MKLLEIISLYYKKINFIKNINSIKNINFKSFDFKNYHLKRIGKNNLFKEKKGSIFTGLSLLFIFCFIISIILILNFSMSYQEIISASEDSNSFNYVIENHNKNIPVLSKDVISKLADDVIKNHNPSYDSREIVKDEIQKKLEKQEEYYQLKNGINIENEVLSVYNGKDPFHINVKTIVNAKKGKESYSNVVESVVSIEGLKDPLPFLMCREHPTLIENGTKIDYNDALSYYMVKNGLLNPKIYENATGSLIIRKCIYDPYKIHGEGYCMKNCIDNGYFHESADGSCYLCRLEGKGSCYHYGLEVFIVPQPKKNINGNITEKSISGSDHVLFNDHYPGNIVEFFKKDDISEILVIDDSHRAKYGIL